MKSATILILCVFLILSNGFKIRQGGNNIANGMGNMVNNQMQNFVDVTNNLTRDLIDYWNCVAACTDLNTIIPCNINCNNEALVSDTGVITTGINNAMGVTPNTQATQVVAEDAENNGAVRRQEAVSA